MRKRVSAIPTVEERSKSAAVPLGSNCEPGATGSAAVSNVVAYTQEAYLHERQLGLGRTGSLGDVAEPGLCAAEKLDNHQSADARVSARAWGAAGRWTCLDLAFAISFWVKRKGAEGKRPPAALASPRSICSDALLAMYPQDRRYPKVCIVRLNRTNLKPSPSCLPTATGAPSTAPRSIRPPAQPSEPPRPSASSSS